LLDQMDKFVRSESGHFAFRISPQDQPVLSPWAPKLAEEAYDTLSKRFGFAPRGPLEFEIFPDHGGFAVRTLGLAEPHFGAVGVCFGKVVALDSPRAQKLGSFNWGSTLWHEFTHVMTLQMTNHNIPRWYSEGISVYEERRARPGWGDHMTAGFLEAYKDGKLLAVSELNAGMMRPKFPEQVLFSYYEASLVCDLIEQRFGFDKIRQTLELFAQNRPADDVFQTVLGWDAATLDREFRKFLDDHVRAVAPHLNFDLVAGKGKAPGGTPDPKHLEAALARDPDDFFANWQMGILLHSEKEEAGAEAHLKRAQKTFPQFTDPGNPYELLSEIYLARKREDEALAQFKAWAANDSNNTAPLLGAAEIYRKRKDWQAAEKMLELAVYVNPFEPVIHTKLGEAAGEAGNWPAAVRAFRTLVGLNPADPAEAHYNLARALIGTGNRAEAKREVLRALEIAPTYEKAQELLLKLSGGEQ